MLVGDNGNRVSCARGLITNYGLAGRLPSRGLRAAYLSSAGNGQWMGATSLHTVIFSAKRQVYGLVSARGTADGRATITAMKV